MAFSSAILVNRVGHSGVLGSLICHCSEKLAWNAYRGDVHEATHERFTEMVFSVVVSSIDIDWGFDGTT